MHAPHSERAAALATTLAAACVCGVLLLAHTPARWATSTEDGDPAGQFIQNVMVVFSLYDSYCALMAYCAPEEA